MNYLIGSGADRDILQTFTAEFNRDRPRRGLPALANEALLRTALADAGAVGTYLAFLGAWQDGRAQALRLADLR